MVSYAARYYNAFDGFIPGFILFFVIQTIFILYFLIHSTLQQKEKHEEKFRIQELENLKTYTEQLEKNQDKLAKFRHDYKNLMLSLKGISSVKNNNDLLNQINHLAQYSTKKLDQTGLDYRYFKNVKNEYIKSLLFAKFYQADENLLNCYFECLEVIDTIPMPIFDCVRVLGISLDNAIEASIDSQDKKLSLMIYQDEYQVEFLIKNSCKENNCSVDELVSKGVSTKDGHEGIGMNNIREINKKNKNMFVQYKKEQLEFTTQIILMR